MTWTRTWPAGTTRPPEQLNERPAWLSQPQRRGRRRAAPVAVNLLGQVEHPAFGDSPYRIDVDGVPYVPVGDGGLVLGVRLGDSVFDDQR